MPALPLPAYLAALAACAAYIGTLWVLDVYTPPDVRHWQRLARLRGLEGGRDLGARVGGRLPLVGRLRAELDVGSLLMVAGSLQGSESWFAGTAAYALSAGAAIGLVGAFGFVYSGRLPFPLWVVLITTGAVALQRYIALRTRASRRRARVSEQLADALLGLAVLVPGIPPEDALALLARCQRDGGLVDVLDEAQLARVLGPGAHLRSTRDRYSLLGRSLGIPLFQELAQLMRGIETEGLSPREEYPALSRVSADQRLAQNRLRAARARTGAAAAIALLLVPLLMLVGGGIAFAFLGAVNG